MMEEFILVIQFLIFPGALFLIILAFFYEWIDRKVVARIQKRVGPLYTGPSGILQPFADFLKLLQKEDLTPDAADSHVFNLAPIVLLTVPLSGLFLIPIAAQTSMIAFEGDVIFMLFLFSLIMIVIFLAGFSSRSRFATIGSARAALQMVGYEIPLGLAMIGPAIASGSLSFSGIAQWQLGHEASFILLQPIGFAVLIISLLAELEFVPFDMPHANTEIVAGWKTEYSGRKLALIQLGKNLQLVLGSGIAAALYLGGAHRVWFIPPVFIFLIKTIFVIILLSVIRAAFARSRIEQMVSGMWKYVIPMAVLQIILIQLSIGGG
ncbi:MAG: complex I subunit 1 family protein [Candidatus Thorarchaeota archaeon]